MSANLSIDPIAEIRQRGYVILEDAIPPAAVQSIRTALEPWLQGRLFGRNDFEGFRTERVYALLAKSPEIAQLVEHEEVLRITDALLPVNYLLSAALAINLHPGETEQNFHLDDGGNALPIALPRQMLGVSTIWAIDEFTPDNGATEIVPGSHLWDEPRKPAPADVISATMSPGSVLVFAGNMFHRGGANQSQGRRLGITIQYCNPHMRQLENMTLVVGPQRASDFSERIQALLGYSIVAPGFKGYVDGRHPKALIDPDYRGRKYRDDLPES